MKKFYALILLVLIGYGVYFIARLQDSRTDGFRLERIAPIFPDDPRWEIAVSDEAIYAANRALNQPYYYLGHGFQCYAFASQDGKYVLKFIREQRLQPPLLFHLLPNFWFFKSIKEEKEAFGRKRADYLFRSLKVAFEDVPSETGLLFVHLNKTKGVHPVVTIYDKANGRHEVALDEHEFVLQKRALAIKPTLEGLVEEGKIQEAKGRIDQIFSLLYTCAKKGIADNDNQLIRKNNLGFLPQCAIYIDTGKITRKESMKTKARFAQDLQRLKPLHEWLQNLSPELADHFLETQETTLTNF